MLKWLSRGSKESKEPKPAAAAVQPGESAKPHEPSAYSRDAMSNDILNLMDHLGIERAHIMGYSMGSRLAIAAAMKAPKRFATLTIGGVGDKMFEDRAVPGNPMAEAMEAADIKSIKEPMLKSFRAHSIRLLKRN